MNKPDAIEDAKRAQELLAIRNDLIAAISGISKTLPAAMRNYVDSYIRLISPSHVSDGESYFAQNPKPHSNVWRTILEGRNANLLAYIGLTIQGYYRALQKDYLSAAVLKSRIALLQRMADKGFADPRFQVAGNPSIGYTLVENDGQAPDPAESR